MAIRPAGHQAIYRTATLETNHRERAFACLRRLNPEPDAPDWLVEEPFVPDFGLDLSGRRSFSSSGKEITFAIGRRSAPWI